MPNTISIPAPAVGLRDFLNAKVEATRQEGERRRRLRRTLKDAIEAARGAVDAAAATGSMDALLMAAAANMNLSQAARSLTGQASLSDLEALIALIGQHRDAAERHRKRG